MTAAEAKRDAQRALDFMQERRHQPGGVHECFGFAWGTLARIAGQPGLPLPKAASDPTAEGVL